MAIETVGQLAQWFRAFDQSNDEALGRGFERGLRTGANEIRQDAPPDPPREWNLRAGIGVDERWPRQQGPIPGFEGRQDYRVRVARDEVTGVIGSGMLYTKAVLKRNDFMAPGLARTPTHIAQACAEELSRVEVRA